MAVLSIHRLQHILQHFFWQARQSFGEVVGVHVFKSIDHLGGHHFGNDTITHFLGKFFDDIAVKITIEQFPQIITGFGGAGFKN